MIEQLDKNTRVKLKFHLPALSTALCLQRKVWYGWKTVSWNYPSIMKDYPLKHTIEWLCWAEDNPKSERSYGEQIMNNNK